MQLLFVPGGCDHIGRALARGRVRGGTRALLDLRFVSADDLPIVRAFREPAGAEHDQEQGRDQQRTREPLRHAALDQKADEASHHGTEQPAPSVTLPLGPFMKTVPCGATTSH